MKTILVAEDEQSNYMYLNVLLRSKYNVLHAINGAQAVEMAREHKPDLILLDVKMPEKSGIEALDEIRTFLPKVPIVMQSAYAFDSDINMAMMHSADGYLTKPILKGQLDDMIAKFL